MKRRHFLAAAAGAIAGIPVGAAYAQQRGTRKLGNIGLQLYTLRQMMEKNVGRTLEAVARAGYKEVEFAGYFNVNPPVMKKLLDANGLIAPSSHIQMGDLGMKWELMVEDANTLGSKYLTVAWIDAPDRTPEGYKRIAERFNRAGLQSLSDGVQLAYHNYSFDFTTVKGQLLYDVMMKETDPRYVAMQADVFWMKKGGQDPVSWLTRYPGRFHMMHLKDMGPPPKNDMRDVGKGTIDWQTLNSRGTRAGVKHWFVEHDETKNPVASIQTSYKYLRALRFS
jgi:sugar phosphate isomerase/epimerase